MINESKIQEVMSHYQWYHIMQLSENIFTPGNPAYVPAQNLCMKYLRSLDLKGKKVLDIGCRDGLFSFAAEQGGAAEVIGIDNDLSKAAVEFLIPFSNSKVKMYQMNLYDLRPESFGFFDIVIFPGVLYHLRYPFWGLKVIRDVLHIGSHLLIETAIWKSELNKALLFCPIDKESPYEGSSCTFFNVKGLMDTLKSIGFETVAIEHLNDPPLDGITRSVFHCIFNGFDEKDFVMKYWENTHDFHSLHGG
jgi:SAM-dependent methyltransferase